MRRGARLAPLARGRLAALRGREPVPSHPAIAAVGGDPCVAPAPDCARGFVVSASLRAPIAAPRGGGDCSTSGRPPATGRAGPVAPRRRPTAPCAARGAAPASGLVRSGADPARRCSPGRWLSAFGSTDRAFGSAPAAASSRAFSACRAAERAGEEAEAACAAERVADAEAACAAESVADAEAACAAERVAEALRCRASPLAWTFRSEGGDGGRQQLEPGPHLGPDPVPRSSASSGGLDERSWAVFPGGPPVARRDGALVDEGSEDEHGGGAAEEGGPGLGAAGVPMRRAPPPPGAPIGRALPGEGPSLGDAFGDAPSAASSSSSAPASSASPVPSPPRTARLLDGRAAAERWERGIALEASSLRASLGRRPALGVLLVGARPDSELYVSRKLEAAARVGVDCALRRLPASATTAEVVAAARALSRSPDVDGVLVQLPLPPHVLEESVAEAVDPGKDVDGFHPLNVGKVLMRGRAAGLVPATALACFRMLRLAFEENVVVLGDSNVVGLPVSTLARDAGAAIVTVVHRNSFAPFFQDQEGKERQGEEGNVEEGPAKHGDATESGALAEKGVPDAPSPSPYESELARITRTADVLLVAVGYPELVQPSWVKPGAAVIDVGINVVRARGPPGPWGRPRRAPGPWPGGDEARARGLRLAGDVHPGVAHVAAALTPVPGGVGPMTIAATLENTLKAAKLGIEERKKTNRDKQANDEDKE